MNRKKPNLSLSEDNNNTTPKHGELAQDQSAAKIVDPTKNGVEIGFIKKYFEDNPEISYIEQDAIIEIIDNQNVEQKIKITHGIIKMYQQIKENEEVEDIQLYSMLKKLGSGGSGGVWEILPLGRSRTEQDFSIVKIAAPEAIEQEFLFRTQKLEENVGLTVQPDDNPGQSYMFGYKLEGKTLGEFFEESIGQPESEEIQLKVILAVLKKLQELHEKGIVHGDFHANNILINIAPNGEISVSITDYRFSGVEGELATGNVASWSHISQGGLEANIDVNSLKDNQGESQATDTFEEKVGSLVGKLNKKTDFFNLGQSLKNILGTKKISPEVKKLLYLMAPSDRDPDLTKILTGEEYIAKLEAKLKLIKQKRKKEFISKLPILKEIAKNLDQEKHIWEKQAIKGTSPSEIRRQTNAADRIIANLRRVGRRR